MKLFIYDYPHIHNYLNAMSPANFFKCLSDDTRLRCIALLQKQGKLCVCELTAALGVFQPKISRHLALLRQCGLLIDSREGQWVFYQINPKMPDWTFPILANAVQAMEINGQLQADLERLHKMENRPELALCC